LTSDATGSDEKHQALTLYSARLRPDQIAFLRGLPNASEWLRKVIDDARIRDSATSTSNRVILLTQQIRELEQQIGFLAQNPSYLQAKERFNSAQARVEKVTSEIVLYEAWIRGENPPEGKTKMERFYGSHEKKLSELREQLAALLAEQAPAKTIIAGFDEEIRALETKRKGLEQELLREGATSVTSVTSETPG
jgi:chromosome segregation ATPase